VSPDVATAVAAGGVLLVLLVLGVVGLVWGRR
jgi:hypothetical protein